MTFTTRTLTVAALIISALPVAGCASRQQGSEVAGASWQKICDHPSMNEAAYREAFACHRPEIVARTHRAEPGRAHAEVAALETTTAPVR